MQQTSMLNITSALLFYTLLISVANCLPLKDSHSRIRITKRSTPNVQPTPHMVSAGHDIELECEANGPTPPVIHWLFNGEHVEQSPLDHLSENIMAPVNPGETVANTGEQHDYYSIATLIIKSADSQHSGRYTCVADLPGDRQTKSYDVQVSVPSLEEDSALFLKRTDEAEDEEDTRIYLYTDSVYEAEGVSTRLICRATQGIAKSPPTVTWTLDGETITNATPGYEVAVNGDLKILRTSLVHHMADLRCTAEGNNGKSDVKEPFIYLFEPEQ